MITLPSLPFAANALEPIITQKTIDIHYGKHHTTYVNKLNELIANTPFADLDLESIVKTADKGPIFNNAAQIWNHTFYRNSLRPAQENNLPTGALAEAILAKRGSFDTFKTEFSTSANTNFGSGRTRLIQNPDGSLAIFNTSNAETPLTTDKKPLFTVDVWEHAYYLDYQNRRPDYTGSIRNLINRDFASSNFTK